MFGLCAPTCNPLEQRASIVIHKFSMLTWNCRQIFNTPKGILQVLQWKQIYFNTNRFWKVTLSFRNPIRITWSVTFTVIRFLVLIRLQNCSGINWGKVVRALIKVHCRSPSMNFASSSKRDWLKYCNSKRHWWKKGSRWVPEAHDVTFKNLLVQRNYYVFAMVSAPTIDPSFLVDLSQIVCWVRSRTSTSTRRSNQLTESDQKATERS